MSFKNVTPVVMAGGLGRRLWPLSTSNQPKQFLKLFNEYTLFQNTLIRLKNLGFEKAIVVVDSNNQFLAKKQSSSIEIECHFLIEPEGKNTAPAFALACFLNERDEENLFLIPSDHLIKEENILKKSLPAAIKNSEKEKIVLFGIKPNFASTSYGYIEAGESKDDFCEVKNFHEKPDQVNAKKFAKMKNFYWNSGMLMVKAHIFLDELREHRKDIFECVRASISYKNSSQEIISEKYNKVSSESIDYCILEKTNNACLIPLKITWDDLGSWESISNNSSKDEEGNVLLGNISTFKTKNSYISSSRKHTAVIGQEDLLIIDTDDALLVSPKKGKDNLKKLLEQIKKDDPSALESSEVIKPWGNYKTLIKEDNFQIKILNVSKSQKISLQKHKYRSEHWTILSGEALITKGKENFILKENESVFFDQEEIHSVENIGNIELKIAEVQIGSYLGEDDIERLEDRYDRT